MNFNRVALCFLLLAGLACAASAQAEELLAKTHKGAKEAKVAAGWFQRLPAWINSLTSKNQFLYTTLPLEFQGAKLAGMRSGTNKFEIRDANERQFRVYLRAPQGLDTNGLPTYVATEKADWVAWRSWPARFVVETYPIESNPDVNEVVAFGVWLYTQKENHLANRVLTVAAGQSTELAPFIQGYICEKEKWDLPAGGLTEWAYWDAELQKELKILVTPEHREKLIADREKQAETAYKELVNARGDYKGKPPRRRSPMRPLIRLNWDIKQLKIAYQNAEYLKGEKQQSELQLITDSIKDDLAIISERRKEADGKVTGNDPHPNMLKDKAMFLEANVLPIDPMDFSLRLEAAEVWYAFGKPEDHGNGCARTEGIKKAIPHYKIVVEVYPYNTKLLIKMGRCYQALEDSKNALPYYERVIDIDGTAGLAPTAKALIRNMEEKDKARTKKN